MAAAMTAPGRSSAQQSLTGTIMLSLAIRLVAIALVDVLAFWLAFNIAQDGNWSLALIIVVVALGVSVINLWPSLWPLRWMAPGLALMTLLAIYPIFYTVYVAFTNFSDGHRATKAEAIALMSQTKVLAEGGTSYAWEVFRSETGQYALWLTAQDGSTFFASQGQPVQTVTPNQSGEAPFTDSGVPASIDGYALLAGGERFRALNEIQDLSFGTEAEPIGIKSRNEAGAFVSKWQYNEARNALIDVETNTPYLANDNTGEFVAPDGSKAPLGYWVSVGFQNFARVFNDISVSEPLIRVFLWTIGFALFSVLTSFAVGLGMALVLNKDNVTNRILKSLLIIPYAIPGMISILIWRGMLNPNGGVVTTTIASLTGITVPWQSDPLWAKIAIILVNLWLSYPYFMLICSGALQSIPSSIYEAAEVDGANAWERFWSLTLPLLLVAVGPLLIASFIFNFNNYLLIEALFQGGPTMIGTTAPPVGHTDNLISYTFRFAFGSGGTRDFGFASAIAIVIFFLVGLMTLVQFRLTRRWEEVGENV
jgi:arabinogalactan oligomer / maltooligosaccharide transport system permease protein